MTTSMAKQPIESLLPPRRARRTVERAEPPSHLEVWGLTLLSFVVSLVTGFILVFHYNIILVDSLARVMNAYYVFYHGTPHFAAIGFIWNPLPSLLEMPFTWLSVVWKPVVTQGISANVVSALFSGVGTFYLHRVLTLYKFPATVRIVWSMLYLLNPMILLYSANGMSDIMLANTFVAAIEGVLTYLETDRPEALSQGAIWLAIAFLVRYEAIPFAAFIGLALVVGLTLRNRTKTELEGTVILVGMPIAYATSAWMFLNWLIMKDPLYFITSPYGNSSHIGTGAYDSSLSELAHGNFFGSIGIAAHFAMLFWPVILGSALGMLWTFVRDSRTSAIVLIAGTIAIPTFQSIMMYLGKTAIWDRFFITYIPMGFLLLIFIASRFRGLPRLIVLFLLTVIITVGDFSTWLALQSPVLGRGDDEFIQAIISDTPVQPSDEGATIANYVDTQTNLTVLVDTFDAGNVVANVKHHNQLVITNDLDFNAVLSNPKGRVDAILVPQPSGTNVLNAFNRMYPDIWSGKVYWTRLIKEFPGPSHYRLYAITSDAP